MRETKSRSLVVCILMSRPVARIFYGDMRSNEETDRPRPEGAGGGGGGGLRERLHYERFEKLAISQIVFKSNFVF